MDCEPSVDNAPVPPTLIPYLGVRHRSCPTIPAAINERPMDSLEEAILERLRFEIEMSGGTIPGLQAVTPERKVEAAGAVEATGPAPASRNRTETEKATLDVTEIADSSELSPYDRIAALIPADSPLRDFQTLAAVEEWVAKTELIELDKTRLNPVFGVGNPDADLMVIGEAPGANEDEQGEPFVGRAGQLLNDILAAIKFARSDVYIANILKSRPTKNRNPTPYEVEAHIPILYKQIALIRPRILLCVGKVAGNSLLGNTLSLSAMRGDFQDFHGLPTVVTFHPAALLRNPEWKRPTWEDVKRLKARYDELVGSQTEAR